MWELQTPKVIVNGRGSIQNINSMMSRFEITRPLVVIDREVKLTEFGDVFSRLMNEYPCLLFSEFSTNPTTSQINCCLHNYDLSLCDGVISIGGGSAIDLAKAVNLVISHGGTIEDYLNGKTINGKLKPCIAVPTTCGAGAESSPYAVITDTAFLKKRGISSPYLVPDAVLLDADSLNSLSRLMIAATGIDSLTHVLESHISKKATPLTRISSRGLLLSFGLFLEQAIFKKNEAALENLHDIAFTARLLYPRTGLSVAHALSHPVGAHTNLHHGMAVALFLITSLRFNKSYCAEAFDEAEEVLGLKRRKLSLLDWIARIINESGITSYLVQHISKSKLPLEIIAEDSLRSSNIASNPRPVDKYDMLNIITESLEQLQR
ncbi:MAG: Alcohol dehydrogenase, class IV [Candidatus Electronema aureum]|uniref:Alcohol dehydrogenase, class IV n=1 Tax=Candidatus Electronema aureum TaxID=2005002 RepID=A0A521G201_9BACT|nr:MAG: Alcohol dehydrogenase, class IV [Candidatus Electronema aureum]